MSRIHLSIVALVLSLMLPVLAPAQLDSYEGVEPLPVEIQQDGALFRIKVTNPAIQSVFVVGTHNGWGDQFAAEDPVNANDRMYGPDADGVYELYYPLVPGTYAYMFCLNGDFNKRIYGHSSDPKASEFFEEQGGEEIHNLKGSILQFRLDEPPWPPVLCSRQMMPTVITRDGKPFLRVRFYDTSAETVHMLGSWNDWKGAGNTFVSDDSQRMRETPINGVYEYVAGPLPMGEIQYKFVVDRKNWLSDPVVEETNSHGNSIVRIEKASDGWKAVYTPRFDPDKPRGEWVWDSGRINWITRMDEGFRQAKLRHTAVFWVIALPGSKPSEDFLNHLDDDDVLRSRLERGIVLKTPAHEFRETLRQKRIVRLPYVMIADEGGNVLWEASAPESGEVDAAVEKYFH
ncbi:hypothetical protein KQI84_19125 [bacterium]|nr:hypothetical protein [bacterium]